MPLDLSRALTSPENSTSTGVEETGHGKRIPETLRNESADDHDRKRKRSCIENERGDSDNVSLIFDPLEFIDADMLQDDQGHNSEQLELSENERQEIAAEVAAQNRTANRLRNAHEVAVQLKEKAKNLRRKLRQFRSEQSTLEDELFRELSGTGLILSSIVQGSSGWHKSRAERVTASQFGVVCGVSDFARPVDLWMLRTGRVEDPFRGNADTARGNTLEPVALAWYKKNFCSSPKVEVQVTGHWLCEGASYLGASPDGLIGEDGLIEIKCPRYQTHEYVPAYYMAQVQGQLHITKRAWCDFVSYHQTQEPTVHRVYYSKAYWDWMFPQLRQFYFHIQMDEPPALLPLEKMQERQKEANALCRVERLR